MPTYATRAPFNAPKIAPRRQAAADARSTGAGLRQPAGDDAADGKRRADRDVDLPGDHDERHPDGDEQHREVGEKQIAEILR